MYGYGGGVPMRASQSGQSLVEVVVALGIVLLLVSGLVAGTTYSLRFARASKERTEAIHLATDAIEQIRRLRDKNWDTFKALCNPDPNPPNQCLTQNYSMCTDGSLTTDPQCPSGLRDLLYNRIVLFEYDAITDMVIVTAATHWGEAGENRTVRLKTYLTKWK